MAVVHVRGGPIEVDGPAVADLEVRRMAQPHAHILSHPASVVADIDFPCQGTVDRIANLLETVDDDVDPAASPRDQPVNVACLDREATRAEHSAQPVGNQAAICLSGLERDQTRGSARQIESKIAGPAGTIAKRVAGHEPAVEAVAVEILEHDLVSAALRRPAARLTSAWPSRDAFIPSANSAAIVFLRTCSRPASWPIRSGTIDKRLLMPRAAEETRQGRNSRCS